MTPMKDCISSPKAFYSAFFVLFLNLTLLLPLPPAQAQTLDYYYCNGPQEPSCILAFQKIAQLRNPMSKEKNRFFNNGIHNMTTQEGELIAFPAIYVTETDIDRDGYNEIIAKVTEATEEEEGLFCPETKAGVKQCPHFIIQDRNISGEESNLKNFRIMGPIYAYFIGLSTNERFGGYRSLVAYRDTNFKTFAVYQYDKKTDKYFRIEGP